MKSNGRDQKNILVVDDDSQVRSFLQKKLREHRYQVSTVDNGISALAMCKKHNYAMIILDYEMPEMDGMQVLKGMQEMEIHVPVVMVTAHDTMERAVEAISLGAKDFLTKPFDMDELLNVVKEYSSSDLRKNVDDDETSHESTQQYHLVGSSAAMMKVYKAIGHVSQTDNSTCVLITGESGVGKELVARQVHLWGKNRNEPFVGINLNALPDTLTESELFGHSEGAFTNALKNKTGKLEFARGGTVLLDEIGDLSMSIQVKLLRVLQERQYYPVGSNDAKNVSCRIVAATNADLEDKVERKEFRQDLYYRFRTIWIQIPPLRERPEDIPLLVEFFLQKHKNPESAGCPIKLSEDALALLKSYCWPGNVRELENIIRSVIATRKKSILEVKDFEMIVSSASSFNENIHMTTLQEARRINSEMFERQYITSLLQRHSGKVSKAVEQAGINRQSFYKLMKKYNIRSSDY